MDNPQFFFYHEPKTEYEAVLMKKTYIRAILCTVFLTVVATALSFLRIQPPLLPKMFAIDFSAFPELIAAIAYGPVVGVLVCLVKNVIHSAFANNYLIIDAANFIVESVFLAIAGAYYIRKMFPMKREHSKHEKKIKRFYREKTIFVGSFIGIIASLPVKFIATNYFVYPLLEKEYAHQGVTAEKIVHNYNASIEAVCRHLPGSIASIIPEIKTVWQGILMINLPIAFVKLLLIVILTVIIYPFISPFLHSRPE